MNVHTRFVCCDTDYTVNYSGLRSSIWDDGEGGTPVNCAVQLLVQYCYSSSHLLSLESTVKNSAIYRYYSFHFYSCQ